MDFVEGLEVMCGAGDPSVKEGLCIYTYLMNKSMNRYTSAFYDWIPRCSFYDSGSCE